jgi:hypothetical protein
MARLARHPLSWIALAVLVLAGAAGLYWFQPWKLATSSTINEVLPSVEPSPAPAGNTLLAQGTIITHEHESSGSVKLIRLADGRVQVVLENLATSDGPDLRVWLTDQPVRPGRDGWTVFDDGRYVEVGRLKANRGNQVYDVPAGTDLTGLTSMTIWCKRFSVSFGAAFLS